MTSSPSPPSSPAPAPAALSPPTPWQCLYSDWHCSLLEVNAAGYGTGKTSAALHQWLPVLRCQHQSEATNLLARGPVLCHACRTFGQPGAEPCAFQRPATWPALLIRQAGACKCNCICMCITRYHPQGLEVAIAHILLHYHYRDYRRESRRGITHQVTATVATCPGRRGG